MSELSAGMQAFEEKVSAQLQEAKLRIDQLEARAKGSMAKAQVDAVNRLKIARQEIDKRREELKTSGDARTSHIQAGIEADMAKLGAALEQFGVKLQGRSTRPQHHSQARATGRSKR